jgi:hypothetical protein
MNQATFRISTQIEELRRAWQEKVILYNEALAERDNAEDDDARFQAEKKAEKIKVDMDILVRRGKALSISLQKHQ